MTGSNNSAATFSVLQRFNNAARGTRILSDAVDSVGAEKAQQQQTLDVSQLAQSVESCLDLDSSSSSSSACATEDEADAAAMTMPAAPENPAPAPAPVPAPIALLPELDIGRADEDDPHGALQNYIILCGIQMLSKDAMRWMRDDADGQPDELAALAHIQADSDAFATKLALIQAAVKTACDQLPEWRELKPSIVPHVNVVILFEDYCRSAIKRVYAQAYNITTAVAADDDTSLPATPSTIQVHVARVCQCVTAADYSTPTPMATLYQHIHASLVRAVRAIQSAIKKHNKNASSEVADATADAQV